jgi:hypothetical protein
MAVQEKRDAGRTRGTFPVEEQRVDWKVVTVSSLEESADHELAAELASVAEAAGARRRAETEQDVDGVRTASESLMSAATSAMAGGYSLRDIAAAETRGQDDVRSQLGGDALKRIERTGRQTREAEAAHHAAIARAVRLGLSTREIAHAAGVTHGTIRAISNRSVTQESAKAAAREHRDDPNED